MVFSVGNSIRNIYKNGVNNSYFLLGDDCFLQKIFIENIKNCLNNKIETQYFYFNEQLDVDLFFNNITTVSLFNNKSIFVVKNFNRLSAINQKLLNEYLNQSSFDDILIFILDDFMIKNKFSKKISEKTTIIDTRTPINKTKIKEWVRYYYKKESIDIDDRSLSYLIDNYSDDISTIINEIEKHYLVNQSNHINSEFISTEYQSKHIKTWNLLDSLGKKEIEKSIDYYNNLYDNGNSLVPILISLYNLYYQMLDLSNTGLKLSYNPLNKILQSRINKYKANYKQYEIYSILLVLRDIDISIKTNVINEQILFLSTIMKICNGYYSKK